jgi:anti-anti-sigma regulatory factor
MAPEPPRLVTEAAAATTLAHFAGRTVALREDTLALVRDQLRALADGPGPGTVVLDFGNGAFLSSRMLGALIALRLRLQETGRRLTLCNVAPAVYEVFDGMDLTVFLHVLRGAGRPRRRGSLRHPAAGGV